MTERPVIAIEACQKVIDQEGTICGEPTNIIDQRTDPNTGLITAVSECRAGHQCAASIDLETHKVYNQRWIA
jgi:hypothetical protein